MFLSWFKDIFWRVIQVYSLGKTSPNKLISKTLSQVPVSTQNITDRMWLHTYLTNGMTMKKLLGLQLRYSLQVVSFLWDGRYSILNHRISWIRKINKIRNYLNHVWYTAVEIWVTKSHKCDWYQDSECTGIPGGGGGVNGSRTPGFCKQTFWQMSL